MLSRTELNLRTEDQDFEAKEAQGRSGKGSVPESVWETYSAMANTDGGVILLGVEEEASGSLNALGIEEIRRVRKNFWDTVNNSEKISKNVLTNSDVTELEVKGVSDPILEIRVPRARRQDRPVYVGDNPFTGSYRRNFEGDYKCTQEEVRRMIAEAEEEARDGQLLPNFGMEDLHQDSFSEYRNEFKSTRPGHPWLGLDDQDLLYQLGGYGKDRETGEEGLTIAGLLMFGRHRPIHEVVDHYALDYQERLGLDDSERWSDRLTTDGTWPGNLFQFYRRSYPRVTRDLRVPFKMEEGKRVDETAVHEALREALVNSLIHADYAGRVPIKIEQHQDRFLFRNPGGLRLPRERVLEGGVSDCRNPRLQKMFQMIGASERAGSGIPRIFSAWEAQQWRQPELREEFSPEQVELELRMISLFPPEVIEELVEAFPGFDELSENKRLAVITAKTEGRVTNRRLREFIDEGRYDVTVLLRELVEEDFLEQHGRKGGTYYELAEPKSGEKLDFFEAEEREEDESSKGDEWSKLLEIAKPVRSKQRVDRETMRETICKLCAGRFLTRGELAELLNRSSGTLRSHYLSEMVGDDDLRLRYPSNPQHPNQAYQTESNHQDGDE